MLATLARYDKAWTELSSSSASSASGANAKDSDYPGRSKAERAATKVRTKEWLNQNGSALKAALERAVKTGSQVRVRFQDVPLQSGASGGSEPAA